MGRLTRESLELLLEEILDAVESTSEDEDVLDKRDEQFIKVEEILIENGLIEIVE